MLSIKSRYINMFVFKFEGNIIQSSFAAGDCPVGSGDKTGNLFLHLPPDNIVFSSNGIKKTYTSYKSAKHVLGGSKFCSENVALAVRPCMMAPSEEEIRVYPTLYHDLPSRCLDEGYHNCTFALTAGSHCEDSPISSPVS